MILDYANKWQELLWFHFLSFGSVDLSSLSFCHYCYNSGSHIILSCLPCFRSPSLAFPSWSSLLQLSLLNAFISFTLFKSLYGFPWLIGCLSSLMGHIWLFMIWPVSPPLPVFFTILYLTSPALQHWTSCFLVFRPS